ncbi:MULTISPECIES: SoxR reducing system RseC family protein [unclassified Uliginosibacterium]|uniref:SoxR reducing system RseC family protein n=1 Tax=unclassified Uliginosibacterium TaxID=2621521 RepID=UPI0013046886|nr:MULTISPECIES: SoxR reducing system RseC family protein [unclassified Uliginosibacterium]MDO6385340.1 SoxR reducing system RseC family protein [Uliginosibacterium sp. 31-12]
MASQQVRILAIRGNTLLVESSAASACGSCHSKQQCGQDAGTPHEIRVAPEQMASLRVLDTISVSLPSGQLLRMAMSAYLPSLAGLLAGLLIGSASGSDGLTALSGAIGFCTGLGLTRLLGHKARTVLHEVRAVQGAARTGCAG